MSESLTPGQPEPDELEWTVPDALAGERVDRAVALATGWSRAEVQAVSIARATPAQRAKALLKADGDS